MTDFVAYYRLSTGGRSSGLGMEVQKVAVRSALAEGDCLIAEYSEIKSARRHDNRPALRVAVEHCRRHDMPLIVSSVDRLARCAVSVAEMIESGVRVIVADMPGADDAAIVAAATSAEWEREKIAQRVTDALAVKRAQLARVGKKLGNPRPLDALVLANAAKRRATPAAEVLTLMRGWRQEKKTYRTIAHELNALGIKTGRGSLWYASTVRLQLRSVIEPR